MTIARFPTSDAPVVVIGAGPGGLTAALELARLGLPVVVLEAGDRVGGLAQTVAYKGFRFDIGGHRFFTKNAAVRELWRAMLGDDFLKRPRLSRIFYGGRFFDYPLKPANALANLGLRESAGILASYARIKLRPVQPEASFEDWVTNRFGRRLYRTFFETYTEKVWGIPGSAISSRWAAQRIQNFSLGAAILHMLAPQRIRPPGQRVKTLIDEFEYPRLGPGMMWEAFAREVERLGGQILLNTRVHALSHNGRFVDTLVCDRQGVPLVQRASSVVSTMPLRHLVKSLGSQVPGSVKRAALDLKYRDFVTVAVIVDQRDVFPDNWIYVHDASVKVGRIQNFKNWSPEMVPDASMTCLGLEYFCGAGDEIDSLSNQQLVDLAARELGTIGLVDPARVVDGTVVRAPNAYPIYDEGYQDRIRRIRRYVQRFENLQTIGRNGTHAYNNQDHSMVMAMLAVRNIVGEAHDLWAVHPQDEYLEEAVARERAPSADLRGVMSTQPFVPTLVR